MSEMAPVEPTPVEKPAVQEHAGPKVEIKRAGKDAGVTFFNPWDRHIETDMKAQRTKFDF